MLVNDVSVHVGDIYMSINAISGRDGSTVGSEEDREA